ncbi:MAG: GH92 family glycosyl hydrolase [Bacteroidota bacterium]
MSKYTLHLASLFLLIVLSACNTQQKETTKSDDTSITTTPLQHVNPLIGTANSTTKSALRYSENTESLAQTVPYVAPPFAMTGWTPQTRATETKCVAPYYYKDSLLQGFRASHWLSGSCVQDYGSMTIMPIDGELLPKAQDWSSSYQHSEETASPAHYSVQLQRYQIKAEMTASRRCGMFRFTWEQPKTPQIVIQVNSDEGEGFVAIDTIKNEIRGYNPVHRIYQGWGEAAGFSGYFVARFDRPIQFFGTFYDNKTYAQQRKASNESDMGAYAQFDLKKGEKVLVKIGTSFTSLEAAAANLEAEMPSWDFDEVESDLEEVWEAALGKIQVKGKAKDQEKFYTALYHSLLHPRLYSDVDGSYPAFSVNAQIQQASDFEYYGDFSMWDVYRAQLPLVHLLFPEKSSDMMQSLVAKAVQGDWLPIFPCWNSYTAAMIGDHCTSVIADAYAKGIRDFDAETAYAYMRKNAFETPGKFEDYKNGKGRRALDSYLKYNYIPMEDSVKEAFHQQEQASRTLEYAYDDFALAQFAKALGKTADYETLTARAQNYRKVFDPKAGYVRGRYANGKWHESFDLGGKKMPYITEGTPRQYSWYVPQDMAGLIEVMGGEAAFNLKLDSMFTEGYYWHGNEPGHQTVYLFNYSGQAAKTQQYVRKIMEEEYGTGPGGLSGNDDAGQMSAWYVFSAMGFYPVCPSVPEYVIGSPIFEEIQLQLGENTFTIMAEGNSEANIYIQSAHKNDVPSSQNFIRHENLLNGGKLHLRMGEKPADWGSRVEDVPYSLSRE